MKQQYLWVCDPFSTETDFEKFEKFASQIFKTLEEFYIAAQKFYEENKCGYFDFDSLFNLEDFKNAFNFGQISDQDALFIITVEA